MATNLSDKGREAAALRAEKRAAALRENLKRRKEAARPTKNDNAEGNIDHADTAPSE